MRWITLLTTMTLILASCAENQMSKENVADQKFLDILKNPSAYDGQRVTVTAWITLREEDRNLWASWEDHENWSVRRCISLSHYDILYESKAALDGRYVKVTGIVRSDASKGGTVMRLASCQNAALEVTDASSVEVVKPM